MNRIVLIAIAMMVSGTLSAQSTLVVKVKNLRSNKGNMAFALLDENKEVVEGGRSVVRNRAASYTFKNLENKHYALQAFHDENNNKEIDKNRIGIPLEGFGFSNDAFGPFGPKKYKKWLFKVNKDSVVTLRIRYLF